LSSFYGSEIIFNNVPSSTFGLRIIGFESGKTNGQAGSKSTQIQKWIYRKSRPYYFGRTINTPLEMDIVLGSELPIDGKSRASIESWLLGKADYLPLQILQSDIDDVTFNIQFIEATNQYMGNIQRSITIHGICDAPFGFSPPDILNKSYSGSAIVSENFNYYNTSNHDDYLYPAISFTTSGIGTSFSLTNLSDDNRVCEFTGISSGETIALDCDRQTITSSTGLKRMGLFNKKFFRLLPDENSLTLAGGLVNFSMSSIFARKIGA
jgi:phage-related protein